MIELTDADDDLVDARTRREQLAARERCPKCGAPKRDRVEQGFGKTRVFCGKCGTELDES